MGGECSANCVQGTAYCGLDIQRNPLKVLRSRVRYLGGNLPYTTTLQRRLLFPSEAFAHERELSHTAPIGQGGTCTLPRPWCFCPAHCTPDCTLHQPDLCIPYLPYVPLLTYLRPSTPGRMFHAAAQQHAWAMVGVDPTSASCPCRCCSLVPPASAVADLLFLLIFGTTPCRRRAGIPYRTS